MGRFVSVPRLALGTTPQVETEWCLVTRAIRLTLILALILSILPLGAAYAEGHPPEGFTLETSISVGNAGDNLMRFARVTVPLIETVTAYGAVVEEKFSHEPREIVVGEDGSRQAIIMVSNIQPGQTEYVTVTYTIDPGAADEARGEAPAPEPGEVHPQIRRQARLLTWRHTSLADKAHQLLEFTHGHIRYDKDSAHRNSDALTALEEAEGVCEDYALLFVALAEAVGIESRVVYGYRYSAGRDAWERHAWVEFVNDEDQWVPADPTFHPHAGLSEEAPYVAQWYQETPVRVAFAGGRLSAGYSDTLSRSHLPVFANIE